MKRVITEREESNVCDIITGEVMFSEDDQLASQPIPQSNNSKDSVPHNTSPTQPFLLGVILCVVRTTKRYLKNIPVRIHHRYLRYVTQRKRLPKRNTRNKAYILVGYTSKKYVDRKYRSIKLQLLLRRIFVILIILLVIIITYNWLDPLKNSDEYKQMFGIEDMNDLNQEDPFNVSEGTDSQIVIESTTPTTNE